MKTLTELETLVTDQPQKPPIEKWHPELSGDIDIVIKQDGSWWHEGSQIKRQPLVKLFASILRREDDGHYYLVTPVEKWRIQVEDKPFVIVDHEVSDTAIALKTNTDDWLTLGTDNALEIDQVDGQAIPSVYVRHGLWARIGRAVFYRLVELAEERTGELVLVTKKASFSLGKV